MSMARAQRAIAAGEIDAELTAIYGDGALAAERARWSALVERAAAAGGNGKRCHTGASPALQLFRSPGRTEIGGNHTDHNHGVVIVGTLSADIIAAVVQRNDTIMRVINTDSKQTILVQAADTAIQAAETGTSAALMRGVAAGLQRRGVTLRGFDAYTSSSVAAGHGLSSSAAFEMLIATILLHCAGDQRLTPIDIAKVGQEAENVYFGKPAGLEDQIGSISGLVTKIDFQDFAHIQTERVPIDFRAHEIELAIVDSQEDHANLTAEYAAIPQEMRAIAAQYGKTVLREVPHEQFMARLPQLRAACGDRAVLRALHFYQENARVLAQAAALRSGRLADFLALVHASGRSSWMLLQNCIVSGRRERQGMAYVLAVTDDYIDRQQLRQRAACRVHGGGFAGAIQLFLPSAHIRAYRRYVAAGVGRDVVTPLSLSPRGAGHVATLTIG